MMYSVTTFWFDVTTGKSPSGLMTQAVNKATESSAQAWQEDVAGELQAVGARRLTSLASRQSD